MTDLATVIHTDALIALLATTGYPVGNAEAPDAAAPYYVVYRLSALEVDGPLDDPDADWLLPYQVTTVGVGPQQAEDLSDLARATLQGSPLTVAGRSIWRVAVVGMGQVARDDAYQPPLWFVPDTVEVQTAPA
jgi:hypothetical protein